MRDERGQEIELAKVLKAVVDSDESTYLQAEGARFCLEAMNAVPPTIAAAEQSANTLNATLRQLFRIRAQCTAVMIFLGVPEDCIEAEVSKWVPNSCRVPVDIREEVQLELKQWIRRMANGMPVRQKSS